MTAAPSSGTFACSFLLSPLDHHRSGAILTQLQTGATGQTITVVGHGAKDAEANAADVADVDDVPVAEAGGAEVDVDAGGQDQVGARAGRGKERGQQIGQEGGGGECAGGG